VGTNTPFAFLDPLKGMPHLSDRSERKNNDFNLFLKRGMNMLLSGFYLLHFGILGLECISMKQSNCLLQIMNNTLFNSTSYGIMDRTGFASALGSDMPFKMGLDQIQRGDILEILLTRENLHLKIMRGTR
jgi:hypothetical protein